MRYIKLYENFQGFDKFREIVSTIEADFLKGDYISVNSELDKLKLETNELPEYDIYFSTVFPSQDLEEKVGVSGISKKWNLPFGFDEQHLENLCGIFIEHQEITERVFNELLSLNEELGVFKDVPFRRGNTYTKHAVIGGACSRFNVIDIKDFIESRRSIKDVDNNDFIFKDYDMFYSNLFNSVRRKVDDIGYFPSPITLSKLLYSN